MLGLFIAPPTTLAVQDVLCSISLPTSHARWNAVRANSLVFISSLWPSPRIMAEVQQAFLRVPRYARHLQPGHVFYWSTVYKIYMFMVRWIRYITSLCSFPHSCKYEECSVIDNYWLFQPRFVFLLFLKGKYEIRSYKLCNERFYIEQTRAKLLLKINVGTCFL